MRQFPVALLTNGVLKGTHGGMELATPLLRVCMLNHWSDGVYPNWMLPSSPVA